MITTSDGLVLIDTTTALMVNRTLDNIRQLGFDPADIEYVFITEAHEIHYGGAAQIKAETGATICMSAADWDFLEQAAAHADQPEYDWTTQVAPPRDHETQDGEVITVGDAMFTLHITPGHTPGTSSFEYIAYDGDQSYRVLTPGGTGLSMSSEWTEEWVRGRERLKARGPVVPGTWCSGITRSTRWSVRSAPAQGRDILPPVPTPTDVKPGSITCDECPYPYPSKYLDISVYSHDVRISYMDVAPRGTPNGHTVMLLHGNNFGGFYFGVIIDGLIDAGFRVIVPDQIGYGKSSKPIAPYNFNSQARNTWLILQAEQIDNVMVVGHSMGGMLATRFTTQYPDSVERLVVYNPIGLADNRFNRPMTPIDEIYERRLQTDYQSTRRSLSRYVAHDPEAWNDEFETYRLHI